MCSNYQTVSDIKRLAREFGVDEERISLPPELPHEQWPLRLGAFIRLDETSRKLVVQAGQFGLLPYWSKEVAYGRKTYNARSETVAELPSFKTAWKNAQRCVIPAERVFEPCYLTPEGDPTADGKPVRWSIEREDGRPMGVAGIWSQNTHARMPDGSPMLSFAMLTVNAAGHPVFQRMHAPEDEKRMVVILEPHEYDRWLTCSIDEARTFFQQYGGALKAYPAPLPLRKPRAPKQPGPAPVLDD